MKIATKTIQLRAGVTEYEGPQILKLLGPEGAWAVPGTGATRVNGKTVPNVAAFSARVDEDALQHCSMSATKLGDQSPDYIGVSTAALGMVVKSGVTYVVESDCFVQNQ